MRVLPAVALVSVGSVWICPAASSQSLSPRTVLALHWSSEDYPSTPVLDAAIRRALHTRAEAPVDYFAEYLESDRFPEEGATLAFRDYLRDKYRGRRIDVVLAITDPAREFALRHRGELFPDAPIVVATSAAPDAYPPDVALTGVAWRAADAETLELALTLHPSTERVFVVAQALTGDYMAGVQAALARFATRVQLTFMSERSVPHLVAAVRAVPARSLILFIRFSQEDPGEVIFPNEVVRMVAEASPVPVYVSTDSHVGSGAVGGVLRLAPAIGTRVGEIARRVLDGTAARDIPFEQIPASPVFDWRQLRRWRIPESSLPAGSNILFREISVFEQYRLAIFATAGVLLLQSLLIVRLIAEHRRRRRAETESRRNLAAIAHLDRRAAMGELATSLAHELNQPLNAILQNAGVAQMLLRAHPLPAELGEMAEIISDISKDDLRASQMIRRMRGLLQKHELETRPVDVNEVVQDAVAIVRPDAQARGVQLETDLTTGLRPILGDRTHLQQVLLNLVMNAMDAVGTMPSELRRVRVWSMSNDGEVRVGVADTGTGIPAERLTGVFEPFYTTKGDGDGMGMGLAIARGIVEAHAGCMAAENNAGGGATVWFSIPMSREG